MHDDSRIWKPWRCNTQRFALDEYIIRYDFKTYLYQSEDAEMIKKYIFKELSALRIEFIKLINYIEYKELKEYTNSLLNDNNKIKKEIEEINNKHKELFDSTLENISLRKWNK